MDSKAMPERIGMNVDVDQATAFLDDVPDLHERKMTMKIDDHVDVEVKRMLKQLEEREA